MPKALVQGGIGGLVAMRVESAGGTKVYFPMADHNGNILGLVDEQGQEVAGYEYSPFGEPFAGGPAKEECPLRFQSKYYDPETGLYYFGYRYYDPRSTGVATVIWLVWDRYAHAPASQDDVNVAAKLEEQEFVSDFAFTAAVATGGIGGGLARDAVARSALRGGTQWFITAEAGAVTFATTRNAICQVGDDSPGIDLKSLALDLFSRGRRAVYGSSLVRRNKG